MVDEYHAYRAAVGRAQSAADGMAQALSLSATSALAPSGWALSKITLKGTQLHGRDSTVTMCGLLSTAKAWLGKRYQSQRSILTVN
ncbi:hypothetical protein QYZ44_17415 [Vibrio parahaemolyticus]|nr:hypothetical protein [Vibrio parahaemolyticus]